MDYKILAKQLLKSKRQLEAARQNLADEIYMLEEAKTAVHSCLNSASPTGGGGNRFEDRLVKLICLCDDLRARQRNVELNLECIKRGLAELGESEKDLLNIFYIEGGRYAADAAMSRLHKERSSVYRDLDKALGKFTSALYGGDKLVVNNE